MNHGSSREPRDSHSLNLRSSTWTLIHLLSLFGTQMKKNGFYAPYYFLEIPHSSCIKPTKLHELQTREKVKAKEPTWRQCLQIYSFF